MSIEARFPLGLHEFLRYAIPGYIYLFVLLPPIYVTDYRSHSILLLLSLPPMLSSTLLIVAGPIFGFLIFHIYYAFFKHLFYRPDKIKAFMIIREHAKGKLGAKEKLLKSEFFVRALEDLAVHSKSDSDTLEPLKERMIFLFSSFHSLGATLAAILAGMCSWAIWEFLDLHISGQIFQIPSVEAIIDAAKEPSVKVFTIFAALWIIISLFLLDAWRHRKNLAIELENLLAAVSKHHTDEAIEAIVEETKPSKPSTKRKSKSK